MASICIELSDDEEGFADRADKQWVSMTLGEAYRGLGLTSDEERLVSRIEGVASNFCMENCSQQNAKLAQAMAGFDPTSSAIE